MRSLAIALLALSLIVVSGCGNSDISTAELDDTPNTSITPYLLTYQDVASTGLRMSNIRTQPKTATTRSFVTASNRFSLLTLGLLSHDVTEYRDVSDAEAAMREPIPVPKDAATETLNQLAGDESTFVKIIESGAEARTSYYIRMRTTDVVSNIELRVNPEKNTLSEYDIQNIMIGLAKQLDEKIRKEKINQLPIAP